MHWCTHAALAPHTSLYAIAHGSIILIIVIRGLTYTRYPAPQRRLEQLFDSRDPLPSRALSGAKLYLC